MNDNIRNNVTITPQGMIYLCKCPLENDYKNQLTFANAEAQATYFNSIIYKTCSDYTYVKKDNTINVGYNIDEIINCNYLFYQNVGFTNKIYYCFITNMQYVNENCTRITFETDCFQTYQFDLTYNTCFVEREHVNNDTPGLHTIPENLETGDYIIDNKIKKAGYGKNDINYILATTIYPLITLGADNKYHIAGGRATSCNIYNNNLSGLEYFWYTNSTDGINQLKHVIEAFANDGMSEAIYMLFVCPTECFEKVIEEANIGYWGSVKQSNTSYNTAWEDLYTDPIYKATSLNGYTPRNKKLLCWPYCYILMNNGNGGNAVYQYELFRNTDDYIYFVIDHAICPSASIFLRPLNYKNNDNTYNVMDGLPLGKFPVCSWNVDAYTNWLTQNSANITFNYLSQAFNVASNVASKNVVGGVGSTLNLVGDVMSLINKRDTMTPQANGNLNSGDVIFSMEETTFTCYQMSIKEEIARCIDSYFDMFGYKVNSVKIPNITGRTNWNYVKTIDCNVEADIPDIDLAIIRQMFNNGVTLWHNPSTIYNYNNSNTIVS